LNSAPFLLNSAFTHFHQSPTQVQQRRLFARVCRQSVISGHFLFIQYRFCVAPGRTREGGYAAIGFYHSPTPYVHIASHPLVTRADVGEGIRDWGGGTILISIPLLDGEPRWHPLS
jgi:hypothetical protein